MPEKRPEATKCSNQRTISLIVRTTTTIARILAGRSEETYNKYLKEN
jgi:hypothetical protein